MKTVLIFLSFMLYMTPNQAQTTDEKLTAVLQKLYVAADNNSIDCPKIQSYNKQQSLIAWYDGASKTIFVEQKAINACLSLGQTDGESALAFIIGHELTHAFQKERDRSAFAEQGCNDVQKQKKETDADIRGVFLAHLAGYKTRSLLPKIVTVLYNTYQFSDKQLPCYRKEIERQKTALLVQSKVDSLEKVFEAARFLGLLGQYEASISCYKYILNFYRGVEVLNDVSVTLVHKAMNVGGKTVDKFLLPLEMDADFRVGQLKAEPLTMIEKQARERDLDFAFSYVKEVLRLNPQYEIAKTNIISILIIKNKLNDAQKYSTQLLKSTRFKDEGKLLNGIIEAMKGETEKAKQAFNSLTVSKNTRIKLWADYNRKILLGEKTVFSVTEKCSLSAPKTVDEVYGYSSIRKLKTIKLDNSIRIAWENRPNSVVYIVDTEGGQKTAIQVVHKSREHIEVSKLSAACIIGQKSGLIALCRPCGLVFQVDATGQATVWGKVLN